MGFLLVEKCRERRSDKANHSKPTPNRTTITMTKEMIAAHLTLPTDILCLLSG